MPKVFLSVCEECGQTYYLKDDEVYVPPNMRPRRRPYKGGYIEGWADWVDYISRTCHYCRVSMPPHVGNDLSEHISALKKEKEDIERVDFDDDDAEYR